MEDWELESRASFHAATAVRLDSQLFKPEAIRHYRLVRDALLMFAQRHPDYQLTKVLMERANAYERRIRALDIDF